MAIEKSKLIIEGENRSQTAFRQVRSSMGDLDKVGDKLTRTLKGLGLGLSLGLAVRQVSGAVLEAEQSEARLQATLKATGFTAGFSAQELENVNAQLVKMSTFDDEGIRNAQAQMVKFGNISGDVFRRALVLSADYAELLGTDLTNGAQQLGRALTAPNIGLTFLERNVGKFSDQTHKSITALIQLGNTAGAQKLILDELDKRIGGTAKTMNTGLTKATKDLTKAWMDMLEAMGRTETVSGASGSGGVLGFFTKIFKATEDIIKNFDIIEDRFKGEFSAKSAVTDPELAAAQQREQAARHAAKAAAEEARARERANVQAAAEKKIADESAAAKAKDIALLATWSQQREDAYNNSGNLQKQLDREVKSIDDETLALANQIAYQAKLKQQQQDRYNSEAALQAQLGKLRDETDHGMDAARELGLTFSSAFEDAIVQAKNLQDVIRGLAQDILRIAIRKTVTEPLAAGLSNAFSGLFPGKAEGGDVFAGRPVLVGESGPELLVPRAPGTIIPNRALAAAGAGSSVTNNIYFSANTPAALRDAVYQMLPGIMRATSAAIVDAKRRGAMPAFA